MTIKTLDRRTFMRGTAAAAVALPLGGLLGSTSLSTGAFAADATNPFSVADGSAVDTVIFNGGYGIDIFFVPLKAGDYDFYVKGMEAKGLTGKFHVVSQ